MVGIYAIENKVTGECYVGRSRNIPFRFQQHITMLERGEHPSVKLQRAYDARRIEDFAFKVLEVCDEDQLDKKEGEWIAKLDTINKGYNTRPQTTDIQPSTQNRLADALYRHFKRECMEYGITISEAIVMIIDREIEESRRNIDLLESLKSAILEGIDEVVYEEEKQKVKRTVRYKSRKTFSEEVERAKEVAQRIAEQEGRLPSRRGLAKEADVTEWAARQALEALRTDGSE